ncbi:hypothetical protein BD626DRAFT_520571 [Schizophyllum amplum]|uniref:BTB domain-containing protein n=1 Tax=Schizophyllum amplum TaxID=97359 RepID=A0A550BUG8_9AGAR|nr:hypothetical protein BD626DRAFT_520571 [Auriculariopsis ampla]
MLPIKSAMTVPLCKVEDLWFPDGNVIIRIGDRVCRVYRGYLASQSPVMADMFSITQPSEGADMVGEVPAMRLPDPPEEVTHWLRAMLLPQTFPSYPNRVGPDQLLSVLRLSHKYDVQYLRQRALHHLAAFFPTDLAAAQAWDGTAHYIPLEETELVEFEPRVSAIAHEVGALWLIPFAMYDLYSWTWAEAHDIATVVDPQSVSSLQAVLYAYKVAVHVQNCFIAEDWLSGDSPSNCSSRCLKRERYRILDDHDMWNELHYGPLTFYTRGSEGVYNMHADSDLCGDCCRFLRQTYSEKCTYFWNRLPQAMGLPPWTELLATKARDLALDTSDA